MCKSDGMYKYTLTKLTVMRARKVQRFLSQPFFVAEIFTGTAGAFVGLEETINDFEEVLSGSCDEIPEAPCYMDSKGFLLCTQTSAKHFQLISKTSPPHLQDIVETVPKHCPLIPALEPSP